MSKWTFGIYFLIKQLDSNKWIHIDANNEIKVPEKDKKRLVQQYGYYFDYSTYDAKNKASDFSDFIQKLKNILILKYQQLKLIDDKYKFNQCIVNNYFLNEGISPHIDVLIFGEVIGCFTLGSGATMLFKKENKTEELYTENCSLSITFRLLLSDFL